MKFQTQQHLHDSHISKQIQTLLSPLVLPMLASLLIISGYRTVMADLNSLSLNDTATDVAGALVLKNSTDLTLTSTAWSPLSGLEEDIENQERDLYENIIESSINNTLSGYESWRNNTVSVFETTLKIAFDLYESQVQYVSTITALIQTLNDTVLAELVQKNTQLSTVQSEISDSLSIGSSIDVSELSIDVSGISDDFGTLLSELAFTNNSGLIDLNTSKDSITGSIDAIFETALEKLEDYYIDLTSTKLSSSNTSSDSLSLIRESSSTSSSTSNGTSTSSSISSNYTLSDPFKSVLISLGCFIVVAYILISILNHFHFQYSSQLRKETYLNLRESAHIDSTDSYSEDNFTIDAEIVPDLEKNIEEPAEDNFNALYHRLRDPTVTIITDSLSKCTGNWYRTYWHVEFLTGRLALVVVYIVSVAVILITVVKTRVDASSDVASMLNSNSTESLMSAEYRIGLPSFDLEISDLSQSVDDWNDFIMELHANVTSSLDDLFEDYNITGVLSIGVPLSPSLSLLNFRYTPLSKSYTLPNVSLSSQTSLQVTNTTSSVSIPSIVAILINKAVEIVMKTVIQTCVIFLCFLGGVCLLMLFIGVVCSLLMN